MFFYGPLTGISHILSEVLVRLGVYDSLSLGLLSIRLGCGLLDGIQKQPLIVGLPVSNSSLLVFRSTRELACNISLLHGGSQHERHVCFCCEGGKDLDVLLQHCSVYRVHPTACSLLVVNEILLLAWVGN